MQETNKFPLWLCGAICLSIAFIFCNDMNQILCNGKWEGLLYGFLPYNRLVNIDIILVIVSLFVSGVCLYKILHTNARKLQTILIYIIFGGLGFVIIMALFMLSIYLMMP